MGLGIAHWPIEQLGNCKNTAEYKNMFDFVPLCSDDCDAFIFKVLLCFVLGMKSLWLGWQYFSVKITVHSRELIET